MVNFENETTITVPATDIVKYGTLNRLWNLQEAWEQYMIDLSHGTSNSKKYVVARTFSMFLNIRSMIARKFTPEEYNIIETQCKSSDIEELYKAYVRITNILDDMGLTKIDTKKSYDLTSLSQANKYKGGNF